MKKLVIVGNGGFAREVEWLVKRINVIFPAWELVGFVDSNTTGNNVVGNDDYIMNYEEELYVSIAIGRSDIRRRLYNKYKTNQNIKYANLIDPSVICSDRVSLGEGNIICAGSILTVDIDIGNCNIINLDCTIGHDVVIEDYVTISPGSNISGHVFLKSGAYIGTGTQIIEWKKIGENSIVGAGAVVSKDIPDDCTAVGIPAKVVNQHRV